MKKITMLLTNAFLPDPRPHKEALSLAGAGYRVKIICWDRGEGLSEKETIDGIEIERFRVSSTHGRGASQVFFLMIVWQKMFASLSKECPDIVYCHDFDTLPVGMIFRMFRRKPVIFDSHEVYSRMLGGNVPNAIKRFVGFLERIIVKRSDLVIVTCPAMKKYYVGLGAKKIAVIGNFKDPEFFKVSDEMLGAERSNIQAGKRLIISYIANFGHERVIVPLMNIIKEDESLFLLIGGDGPQRQAVEAAARSCDRIRYLGYVPAGKVPLYTALSDVIYYGYDKKAGMAEFCNPNKLFEALAAGKAFIGGDFGEMGTIIKEEQCGIALDEFNEANIRKAVSEMKDQGKLSVFKDNAKRAGSERYSWKRAERNLLEAVSRVG